MRPRPATVVTAAVCFTGGIGLSRVLPFPGLRLQGRQTDELPVSAVKRPGGTAPPEHDPAGPGKDGRRRTLDLNQKDWEPVAEAWVREDPQGFYDWLVERGVPVKMDVLLVLFRPWAVRAPETAFMAALNLPADYPAPAGQGETTIPREYLYSCMLEELAGEPGRLSAAVEWAMRTRRPLSPSSAGWMNHNPLPETAAFLAGLPENGLRYAGGLLEAVAGGWARQDPGAFAGWLATLPPESAAARAAEQGWMLSLGQRDFRAALEYLAGQDEEKIGRLAGPALRAMAAEDPRSAFAWMETHVRGTFPRELWQGILQKTGSTPGLLSQVLAMPDPGRKETALGIWADFSSSSALLDAVESLTGHPDDQERVLSRVFTCSPEPDDAGLARMLRLMEGPEGVAVSGHLIRSLAMNWRGDRTELWNRALQLPDAVKFRMFPTLARHWQDPSAAAAAISGLPEGAVKSAARAALEDASENKRGN